MLRNIRCLGSEEFEVFGWTCGRFEEGDDGFCGEDRLKKENEEREDKVKGDEGLIIEKSD